MKMIARNDKFAIKSQSKPVVSSIKYGHWRKTASGEKSLRPDWSNITAFLFWSQINQSMANIVDPGQWALVGGIWSGPALFAISLTLLTTKVTAHWQRIDIIMKIMYDKMKSVPWKFI